uniref:BZIP domain-containing protein n=1 Tax=Steinernema glaseri TaxID=37863 RepID=A0A1I8A1J6_9BILA
MLSVSECSEPSPAPSVGSPRPEVGSLPEGKMKNYEGRSYHRVPSEAKTNDYRDMRVKNNLACREWRQKRKRLDAAKDEKIKELEAKVLELEKRIAYLKGQLDGPKK